MMDFALLNNFWYSAFKVCSALTDVSCLSALYTSDVLGEKLMIYLFQGMLGVILCFLEEVSLSLL